MSNSTVLRILTTFTEVIPAAPNSINTKDIERNLELRGMRTSQSQLSRDLSNYGETFGVQECGYGTGGKIWQRNNRNTNQMKMADTEIMMLIMLEDQLDYLPSYTKQELKSKLERMHKQRDLLQHNIPSHSLFKWEKDYRLLHNSEKSGEISKHIQKTIMQCLNTNGVLKCVCRESPDAIDFVDALRIGVLDNKLYISGISRLHNESNYQYLASDIVAAECVDQCEAYDLFITRAPRMNC